MPILAVLTLLIIAVITAIASRRLRMPFNVALVVSGMVVAQIPEFRLLQVKLDPDVILNLLLPVLLFYAALETNVEEFRANVGSITLLAVLGTFVAVIVIGGILAVTVFAGMDRALEAGLLTGAVLASTDTVSVLSAFKSVRVPKRLSVIVEGESLFNDGAALVAFSVLLEHTRSGGEMSAGSLALHTVRVVIGGAGVGAILGYIAGKLARQMPDSLTCLMMSTIVAYGTYLVAGMLGTSSVIAAVTAGLFFRSSAWTDELPPGTRLSMLSFWEFAGFLVNSVVFLLLGFEIEPSALLVFGVPILWGLIAIHTARVGTVYPMMAAMRMVGRPIPASWQHVLVFGNIKGAISVAMALLVDPALVGEQIQDLIVMLTFGLVLVTLLTQGLTLKWFLKFLGLGRVAPEDLELQTLQLRMLASRSALRELEHLLGAGFLAEMHYRTLKSRYQLALSQAEQGLAQIYNEQRLDVSARRQLTVQSHLLTVEKSAVLEAVRDKMVVDEAADALVAKIDEQTLSLGKYLDNHKD